MRKAVKDEQFKKYFFMFFNKRLFVLNEKLML